MIASLLYNLPRGSSTTGLVKGRYKVRSAFALGSAEIQSRRTHLAESTEKVHFAKQVLVGDFGLGLGPDQITPVRD